MFEPSQVKFFTSLCVFVAAVSCASVLAQSGTVLSAEEFYRRAFPGVQTEAGVLWLNASHKATAKQILGHEFKRLRVRYVRGNQRSAWVLEEIGKEKPITLGVIIENEKIVDVSVLAFRESRGGEIRHGFFTNQFQGLSLRDGKEKLVLDGKVDGITGATLSVRATKKIATLALFFHRLMLMEGAASEQNRQAQH